MTPSRADNPSPMVRCPVTGAATARRAIQSQSQPDAARSACHVQRLQAHSAAKPETRAHFTVACWLVIHSEQRIPCDIIAPFAFVAVRDVLQVFTNVEEGWMYHYST